MQGYRKVLISLILCVGYLAVCYLLGIKGLTAGADPTGLGVMFGGLATGVGAIGGTFVYGNAKEHLAKNGG
jgi:hypothetical protein